VKVAVDDYLVRALVLFKRGRNAWGEAETINALGVGYARLGQIQDAQEQYAKAVELRRTLGNRRGVASTLRNLAQLALIRGDHDTAARQLAEARALFEALDDKAGLAAIDNELGLLAEERGDYADALDAYRRALRGREAIGDALGSAESLNNIGFSHYQLGDYDSAQVFWRQAGEAFAAQDDLNGSTRTQQNLGLLEIARGHWNEARTLLEASLQTAERQQLVEEAAVTRRNLAELELLQGRFAAALEQLGRAQALFAERDDHRGLADAALLRAHIHVMAMDGAGALAALDEAAELLAQASSEQQAIAALLRVQALRLNGDGDAAAALAQAETLARAAGVRVLQLQARVLAQEAPGALDEELHALGHRPLWLLRQATLLAAADATPARYREIAQALAQDGDYARAWQLHRLGAAVLRARDLPDEARAADQAAAREARRVIEAAPESLRDPLTRAIAADGR
jgi:tetratricopeptide (TPR) repeat protein